MAKKTHWKVNCHWRVKLFDELNERDHEIVCFGLYGARPLGQTLRCLLLRPAGGRAGIAAPQQLVIKLL